MEQVWVLDVGDATGKEQRRMMRVITALLDAGVEFAVTDDRGGSGTWQISVEHNGEAWRRDPVNRGRLMNNMGFRLKDAAGSMFV